MPTAEHPIDDRKHDRRVDVEHHGAGQSVGRDQAGQVGRSSERMNSAHVNCVTRVILNFNRRAHEHRQGRREVARRRRVQRFECRQDSRPDALGVMKIERCRRSGVTAGAGTEQRLGLTCQRFAMTRTDTTRTNAAQQAGPFGRTEIFATH